jgi:multidrug efflux pump
LYGRVRDAQIFAVVPPVVTDLGSATGFDMQLENRGGLSHEEFLAARNQLLGMASQDPMLAQVRPNGLEDQPQLHVDTDTAKAAALGVDQGDINTTLSAAWGGLYVNDFIDSGRIKRVYIEGDAPYRSKPEDLSNWQVRNATGTMTPFSASRAGPSAPPSSFATTACNPTKSRVNPSLARAPARP